MIGHTQQNYSVIRHELLSDIADVSLAIRERILVSKNPAIVTHALADADAVGSAIAMSYLSNKLGRRPVFVSSGDGRVPANLAYLDVDASVAIQPDGAIKRADLLIYVDCADPERANPLHEQLSEAASETVIINIDHHVTNTRFGQLNLVVPDAAATCEILEHVFSALSIELTRQSATALLAGIYGDTLGLKTPSTRPSTFRSCAALFESGAAHDLVVDKQFRLKSYSAIKLWAEVMQTVQWRGKLIWAYVDKEMLTRSGAESSEAEGFVNHIAGTIGALASALLYEEDSGWRVSIRSPHLNVDVSSVAARFDGGGHPRAAGCKLPPGLASRERFLDEVAAYLDPIPYIERTIQLQDEAT